MKVIVRWRVAGAVVVILGSGCQTAPEEASPVPGTSSAIATIPAEPPSIAGPITAARTHEIRGAPDGARPDQPVSSDDTGLVGPVIDSTHRILVEAPAGTTPGATNDKAWVTVRRDTPVLSATGTAIAHPWGALMPGTRVRVWFDGPVRESYPVQADAKLVVID